MSDNNKKVLVIFNPVAGKMQIKNSLHDIIDFYTKKGYLVTIYSTTTKNDAYSIILQLQETFDLAVCCGGDGTLNQMVSGMLDAKNEMVLGYLPFGVMNDFGSKLGIPQSISQALETSVDGKACKLDIGMFNNIYFLDVAAFGTFTKILYATSQRLKNLVGSIAYFLEGVKGLSELKSYTLNVEYDNKCIQGDFVLGMITNSMISSKNEENNIEELNDGTFDMLLIKMPENIIELKAVITALLGKREKNRNIIWVTASEIKIRSEKIEWSLDGEFGGCYEDVTITNCHQGIKVMLPL